MAEFEVIHQRSDVFYPHFERKAELKHQTHYCPGCGHGVAQKLIAEIVSGNGTLKRVPLICRIDTVDELDYFKSGGILQYVLRQLAG